MRSACCGRGLDPRLWTVVPNKALRLSLRHSESLRRAELRVAASDSECVCFITAGPITKLFAWGEESGGHVL
jgi:hypothetical protein